MTDAPYKPLDTDVPCIRILRLHPGLENDDIRCSLQVIRLEDKAQDYEALSYTWGRPSADCHLFLGNGKVNITANLRHALVHLRSTIIDRVLWVDAICINQINIEERNSQVARMRDVYANASRVLVWLGDANSMDEDEEVENAMETLLRIYNSSPPISGGRTLIRIEPEQIRHIYRGLGMIFRRPWFSRVWVLQEVVVAKSAIASCGKAWIPFEIFSSLQWTIRMDKSLEDEQRKKLFELDLRAYAEFNQVFSNVITYGRQIMNVYLRNLLEDTCRRQATDPRDKVYGVLGLVWPAPPSTVLRPDYSLSVQETYQKAMVYALDSGKDDEFLGLQMLQYATNRKSYDLPSWCIDFSIEEWRLRLASLSARGDAKIRASGSTRQPAIAYNHGRGAILLSGMIVGSIRFQELIRGPEGGQDPTASEFLETMLHFSAACVDALTNRHGAENALNAVKDGVVWKTLHCGGQYLPERLGSSGPPKSTDRVSLIGNFLAYQQPAWSTFAAPDSHFYEASASRLREGIKDLARRYDGSSVFVTDSGYFGIADGPIEDDDVVAILFGLHTPAVLRPCGESFKLIACTWTQGIMQGEYVIENQASKEQIFSLV